MVGVNDEMTTAVAGLVELSAQWGSLKIIVHISLATSKYTVASLLLFP
jgi:hypothetical protein